ncbi:hypothetical protein C7C46_08565 [Streptomyces tateyamensis]|uniref:PA14 domain-containing protein n=1 Tax=Streptomyces tateyamensis TaxID=565073 RepID=A0A2V4NFB1_9ACTN|nr:DUF6081 family protein [Streptomyces tateyamensis]PYC83789.1 hypothetical protein C7C46_08565 [Streptomyces tateyamensis]
MRQRTLAALAAVGAIVMATVMPSTAFAAGSGTSTVVWDDFSNGFQSSGTGAKWFTVPTGNLPGGDGIPTTSAAGLSVVPTGTNPATGQPAFVYTTGQQTAGGSGSRDQLKFVTMTTHTSSAGYPGFDAPAGGSVSCDTDMAVRTTGTGRNPFGIDSYTAAGDPRLGSGVAMATDSETSSIFDFFVTNTTVYAFYERLRMPNTSYASYSYAVPVAQRWPGRSDHFKVTLDRDAGKVTWLLDGSPVLSVDKIGTRALPRQYMLLDHGGTEQQVFPRQLNCGVGMFTLLDGAGSDGRGLVQLDSSPNYYYSTQQGRPTAQTFADPGSQPQDRLWGQGVDLTVHSVSVQTQTP